MSNITINVDNDYMLGRMNGKTLRLVMIEQQQEINRLYSIRKEAREKLEELKTSSLEVENEWAVDICNIIIEILDKDSDKE